MSTLTDLLAAQKAAKKKKAKKTKTKRDEAGRFVKEDPDLETPSL